MAETPIQLLRSITGGHAQPHLHPVSIIAEEITDNQNKIATINKCYLIKKNYNVGWVMDADAPSCMSCDVHFGLLRRKHHCRMCGIVACNECTSKLVNVPILSDQEPNGSRVCTKCYEKCSAEKISKESIDHDQNSAAELLETLKLELGHEGGKPMEKLSHDQIVEINTSLIVKDLEEVCEGKILTLNNNSIEVRVEEIRVHEFTRFYNKAFLSKHKYKVGWVLYRDHNKCMVCELDFGIHAHATRGHCRLCGIILCGNCSTHRFLIPVFPETGGSKVCDMCFQRGEKFKIEKGLDLAVSRPVENPIVQTYINAGEQNRASDIQGTACFVLYRVF